MGIREFALIWALLYGEAESGPSRRGSAAQGRGRPGPSCRLFSPESVEVVFAVRADSVRSEEFEFETEASPSFLAGEAELHPEVRLAPCTYETRQGHSHSDRSPLLITSDITVNEQKYSAVLS